MAFTGHEVNVVRRNGSGDTDVPCYESYNHHFVGRLASKRVRLVAEPESDAAALHDRPSSCEPIQSPDRFDFTPMQINTKGPNGRGTGPLPRASSAPPGAPYGPLPRVGILECPCTTRVAKEVDGLWASTANRSCPAGAAIGAAGDCFAAAAALGFAPEP
eukprot:gene6717-1342_t